MTEVERLTADNIRLKGLLAVLVYYSKKLLSQQDQPPGIDWEAYRRLKQVVEDSEKALRQ